MREISNGTMRELSVDELRWVGGGGILSDNIRRALGKLLPPRKPSGDERLRSIAERLAEKIRGKLGR